jgi:hypothetical protein
MNVRFKMTDKGEVAILFLARTTKHLQPKHVRPTKMSALRV